MSLFLTLDLIFQTKEKGGFKFISINKQVKSYSFKNSMKVLIVNLCDGQMGIHYIILCTSM